MLKHKIWLKGERCSDVVDDDLGDDDVYGVADDIDDVVDDDDDDDVDDVDDDVDDDADDDATTLTQRLSPSLLHAQSDAWKDQLITALCQCVFLFAKCGF